jgi:uncharacterized heparinase superfamily protein
MTAAWLVNRLRAMSLAEIGWRTMEQAKRRYARNRFEGTHRYTDGKAAVPSLPGLTEGLVKASKAERAAIAAAAHIAMDGGFSALGVNWPRRPPDALFPASIWGMDPVTGQAWPNDAYCFNISYRHNQGIGDVKYVWEFGRLQHLQALAAHHALTGDSQAIAVIEEAIASFEGANPPFRGVHYAEILNVAMRAISLLLASTFCGSSLSSSTAVSVRRMLRSHARWLALFPSRFSSANNHLIAELVAEYLIGVALGDTQAHTEGCWRQLMDEAERQILSDGVNAEQSPAYGAFTAEFLLLAAQVARGEQRPIPPLLEERLCAFADQIFWLSDRRGYVANLCDNDEGRVVTLCAHEPTYPLSVATAICGFFERPAMGDARAEPTLRSALFGTPPSWLPAPQGVRIFETGGLSVVRGGFGTTSYILTFDHGPLGYLAIAAHGHADALSITLTVDDRPVLVDPGTYLYHSGGTERNWFRGTRAHNTLVFGGRDQSVISGPFNWSHKAKTHLKSSATGAEWDLCASHDGYAKVSGVTHERSVTAIAGGMRVHDRLIGKGATPEITVKSEIVFQCAPDIVVRIDDMAASLQRDGKPIARLHVSAAGQLAVASGGNIGDGGWVSERFGEKSPAPRLTWTGIVPPEGVQTTILLGDHQEAGAPELSRLGN